MCSLDLFDNLMGPLRRSLARRLLAGFQLCFCTRRVAMACRRTSSWVDLIDLVFRFAEGSLRPAQVPSEIRQALERIEREPPSTVLEIGTARGGTFLLLSRAARESATLISLDAPGGRWGGGYSRWKTFVFRRMLAKNQTAHFVRASSHEPESLKIVQEILKGCPLDLLFIDGDHSYEGVRADYLMYSRLVRPGGIIAFHDILPHPPELECHVDRFWNEIKSGETWEEIVEDRQQGWGGIGLLATPVRASEASCR